MKAVPGRLLPASQTPPYTDQSYSKCLLMRIALVDHTAVRGVGSVSYTHEHCYIKVTIKQLYILVTTTSESLLQAYTKQP